tara:strand:- start:2723 stop:2872 length:150 start_codon:yes stop_codon:yes gene_type:complete
LAKIVFFCGASAVDAIDVADQQVCFLCGAASTVWSDAKFSLAAKGRFAA